MAHLEVERKPSRPKWVWILIGLLVILLLGMLLRQCVFDDPVSSSDKVITDSTAVTQ